MSNAITILIQFAKVLSFTSNELWMIREVICCWLVFQFRCNSNCRLICGGPQGQLCEAFMALHQQSAISKWCLTWNIKYVLQIDFFPWKTKEVLKIELHFKQFVLWTMLLPIIRGQVYWMCGGGEGIILLTDINGSIFWQLCWFHFSIFNYFEHLKRVFLML